MVGSTVTVGYSAWYADQQLWIGLGGVSRRRSTWSRGGK